MTSINIDNPHAAHVLLVEDDTALGAVTVEVLHRLGYNVSWSATWGDVHALLSSGTRFDAIVLDLGLGIESGAGIVDAARANGYDVPPLIIFSAQPSDKLIAAAKRLGAVGVLQKPCTAVELGDHLRKAIGTRDEHA